MDSDKILKYLKELKTKPATTINERDQLRIKPPGRNEFIRMTVDEITVSESGAINTILGKDGGMIEVK